ncbi:MAG TPA: glycosyltransferase [Methylococcus sp.]|nr:glycosyltransferase [Methylococcus sp.]
MSHSSLTGAETLDASERSAVAGASSSGFAPVVIFCYRRPDHLRRMLESLVACDGFDSSPVIVFGDGPKSPKEAGMVEQTREMARDLLGERAEYYFRKENTGLARSIIEGVTAVVARFGRAIVIEDDLELAPGFLTYMNRALESFADDDRVWQVSGYMFDVPEFRTRSQALFLPILVSWGWATWKRAWDQFDPLATGWEVLESDPSLRLRFNLDGAYDYTTMLKRQMSGQLDSWAIRWYWTVFREDGLVLFPPRTLVHNHGLDGSGTHGHGFLRRFSSSPRFLTNEIPFIPKDIAYRQEDYWSFVRTVYKWNGGLWGKILSKIASFLR